MRKIDPEIGESVRQHVEARTAGMDGLTTIRPRMKMQLQKRDLLPQGREYIRSAARFRQAACLRSVRCGGVRACCLYCRLRASDGTCAVPANCSCAAWRPADVWHRTGYVPSPV